MGTAFLCNRGSGSASLNFRVLGGTSAPSSPKENDIWVNTDAEITSWLFSATAPDSPDEGMVWIKTGTTSPVAFNAIKKNGIKIYPLNVAQYISGAWVAQDAKSYNSGEWVNWAYDVVFFANGAFNTDVFGEVSGKDYSISGNQLRVIPYASISVANAFDVSSHSKLEIVIGEYEYAKVTVTLTNGSNTIANSLSSVGILTLDLSDAVGDYSITLSASGNNYSSNYSLIDSITFVV